ncbi:MAG: GTPase Era [Candidatus Hydrogenedentota bacterium]
MTTYCGRVTVCGKTNVGKSTLLNLLLKEKLYIVSPKPQTTRHSIIGILTEPPYQIIFSDTPGVIEKPAYKLQEVMERQRRNAVAEADIVLWMVESNDLAALSEKRLYNSFKNKKIIMCINKIDLLKNKDLLLPVIDSYKNLGIENIFPISALKNDGVACVKECILKYLPQAPFLYPEDYITEHPERFFVSEIIREKIFFLFHKEVPYSTAVRIEDMKERESGKTYIRATIIVERDSQKAILIGEKGSAIKKIGESARKDIERFINRPVFLDLHVKTVKKWRKRFQVNNFLEPK